MKTFKRWTESEIDELKRIYSDLSNADIAIILNRTVNSIDHCGKRLKLRKSKEYLASLATDEFKSKAARFKKGQTSLRKGVKISDEQKKKMTTMFKKGHKSWHHNYPQEIVQAIYTLKTLNKRLNEQNTGS